jgi:hypothetical protein
MINIQKGLINGEKKENDENKKEPEKDSNSEDSNNA